MNPADTDEIKNIKFKSIMITHANSMGLSEVKKSLKKMN